jgi:DNA-binding NarL/FixJ family response regulator
VYDALRAGAGGFMLKDAPPEEIAAAEQTLRQAAELFISMGYRPALAEKKRSSRRRPRWPPSRAPILLQALR